MALIADSGGIYGLYDASEKTHKRIRAAFEAEPGLVIIPAPLLSEIDYLLRHKLGIQIETYRDLDLSLADACVIACAERVGTLRILTADERHSA